MTSSSQQEPIGKLASLVVGGKTVQYQDLAALAAIRGSAIDELPYVVRILLESALRNQAHPAYGPEPARALATWHPAAAPQDAPAPIEIPFLPARVLLQDLTGVPCVVDLASLRAACVRAGAAPELIEPHVPVDMVVDHSVQVDCAGAPDALARNMSIELRRNRERYQFLRWGQGTFQKLRIVPPGVGICHQVNLEFLAQAVRTEPQPDGGLLAFPDTLVGTDSHTTMVNGLGVLGWGVGGIEAEAAMLGQPISLLAPVVTGVELRGTLRPGVTATDLALAVTRLLREANVVGQFVEFFGEGCAALTLADRSVVANMAPEYGATTGFFPLDAASVAYLRGTGRDPEHCALVEAVARAQHLFRTPDAPIPHYSRTLALDLGEVVPAVAGPRRPHEHRPLPVLKQSFRDALPRPHAEGGFAVPSERLGAAATLPSGETLRHGSLLIASITSCTNTSNPALLLAAGLLARAAVKRGLRVPRHVKTSLVPGSRAVRSYLASTGLLPDLEALGFHVAAYGCGTCIGNSGPVASDVAAAVRTENLVAAAVLSGNRNFEGRIHPLCKANYLASPPLVVAFALAGRIDIDLDTEPLGTDADGAPVFLRDLWPDPAEVAAMLPLAANPVLYDDIYHEVGAYAPAWAAIPAPATPTFPFDPVSTYVREAPFLDLPPPSPAFAHARALAFLGDFITTDHISPAGAIPPETPAGRYLAAHGIAPADFNSYGSRRGNHEVMVRGTFANIRLKNKLATREGGFTAHLPDGAETTIFEAAEAYRAEGVPVIILAGKMYGAGSSRDWAAKGPLLLGVRAVIAQSFERIHRSNLVQMGILPLLLPEGESAESLGLTGREEFDLALPAGEELAPHATHLLTARRPDGSTLRIPLRNRIDTPIEVRYYLSAGILPYTLHRLLGK